MEMHAEENLKGKSWKLALEVGNGVGKEKGLRAFMLATL